MFDLKKQLKNLPEQPGVYLMHDKDDNIIYIGKAKILKNRVRQYFNSSKSHSPKVRAMVNHIAWFEYIVTDSELEALVLECNLIKKYKPHYNILLKDDKHYPYIKVTMNEEYPKLAITRAMKNDGARYFGPYSGMGPVRQVLDVIKKIFLIPTCKRVFPRDIGKARPCLNCQINKCFAPCTGKVSQTEYREVFNNICSFLEGKTDELVGVLEKNMNDAANVLDFEKAALARDKIAAIKAITQKQKIVSDKMANQDVIAFKCYDGKAFIEVFFIRNGRVLGRKSCVIDDIDELSDTEIMSEFLKQFYTDATYIPNEIICQCETQEADLFVGWLSKRLGKKLVFSVPVRGEKAALVKMVQKNADLSIENYKLNMLKKETNKNTLEKLAEYIHLETAPKRIESYDISNISGTSNVGVMIAFKNGAYDSSLTRKFQIKSFEGSDDYMAMSEVVYRRIIRAKDEENKIQQGVLEKSKAKFLPLPDLILLDGGKGHVNTIKHVLEKEDVSIPLFGMVKDDKHHFRALTDGDIEITLPKNSPVYNLVCAISEKVHETAISYHAKMRGKKGLSSELSNINGIGEVKRKKLMRVFKSIDNIANAGLDELISAGIDKRSAQNVYDYFN
ncbi:MAG: excinuclease ABC subunit UvrC [Ruminococcaceae bacterium]|nr:excinuclease ABC subunit UvrC [Oscillospiraceae bacterium]